MSTRNTPKADRRQKLRRLARGLGLAVLALGLVAAWTWQRTLPLERIEVVGAVHAPADEVAALTQAEPDSVALFSLSPALLADRVQRHPWVQSASVRRLPTGTLRIAVEERRPVVLVLGGDGRPSHFLDAEGFAMPVAAASPALYDVPVLHDAPPYHPAQPVESAGLLSLLAALSTADDGALALVSEIAWGRTPTLWTTPTSGHPTVEVRLGTEGHADQLRRLRAFWDQSVLPRPDTPFRRVDLRFDGQVVTLEGDPPAPDSLRAAPDSLARPPAPPAADDAASLTPPASAPLADAGVGPMVPLAQTPRGASLPSPAAGPTAPLVQTPRRGVSTSIVPIHPHSS